MLYLAIGIYAVAMTLANLSVAAFGPAISPLNAFLFIGLDLTLRDWLHVRLKIWQMGCLILVSGLLTLLLNPATGKIALASAIAFTVAAAVDWSVFAKLKGTWQARANASNAAGALVDSLLFPTIAFGALMPHIIAMQFIAKTFGGFLWSIILKANHENRNDSCSSL
jgi:uncharacterized PurR-regulated membrane protein YhhQ (DUF165 family)